MQVAILDPFSGIAGDMMLGALVAVGLEPAWVRSLPSALGLDGVGVRVEEVRRGDVACRKVDFDVPPQPHGRHVREIKALVESAPLPAEVKELSNRAFTAIAEVEAEVHGTTPDRVHLHEVGAVDAILDVVGSVWGLRELGIERVYCGPVSLGDGFVRTAHGILPVPAPATLRLLEGIAVRTGPAGAGELVTPTGAALVRVLSEGPPPSSWVPRRSGFGAGTREIPGRPNALRVIVAEPLAGSEESDQVVLLATDVDDMTPELVSLAVEALFSAGALDVVLLSTHMKKGRPGTRIEVLASPGSAVALENVLLQETSTIGVRRAWVDRRVLPRSVRSVPVLGHEVRIKTAHLPNGNRRSKVELDDVREVARATGLPAAEVVSRALAEAERW